jgi:hypothetical protein
MATATLISLEEYLRTAYHPDCDYVDGVLEERNVGEWNHGDLQGEIVHYLKVHRREWNIRAATRSGCVLRRAGCEFQMFASFPAIIPLSRL